MILCRSCRNVIGQRTSDETAAYLPGLVPLRDEDGVAVLGSSANARRGNEDFRRRRSSLHVTPDRMRTLIFRGLVEVERLPDGLVVSFDDTIARSGAEGPEQGQRVIRVRAVEWAEIPCSAYCPTCGAKNPLVSVNTPT